MHLGMSYGFRQELREPISCASVLKHLRARLLDNDDALHLFSALENQEDYRGSEDFILAVFLPEIKPEILAYYEDRGKQLRYVYTREFINRLDRALVVGYNQGHALWQRLKDTAVQQGLSHRQVVEAITPTLRGMFVPMFKGLALDEYRIKRIR